MLVFGRCDTRGFKPGSFAPWADSVNHYTILLPGNVNLIIYFQMSSQIFAEFQTKFCKNKTPKKHDQLGLRCFLIHTFKFQSLWPSSGSVHTLWINKYYKLSRTHTRRRKEILFFRLHLSEILYISLEFISQSANLFGQKSSSCCLNCVTQDIQNMYV